LVERPNGLLSINLIIKVYVMLTVNELIEKLQGLSEEDKNKVCVVYSSIEEGGSPVVGIKKEDYDENWDEALDDNDEPDWDKAPEYFKGCHIADWYDKKSERGRRLQNTIFILGE